MATTLLRPESGTLANPISATPAGFDSLRDLPSGFMDFFLPLHEKFTPHQQRLATERVELLQRSLEGDAAKENRVAIITLAFFVFGRDLSAIIPAAAT